MSSQHDAAACRCHIHAKIRHTVLANLVRRQQDRLQTMDGLVAAVKTQHAQHVQLKEQRRQLEAAVAAKNHTVQRLHQRLHARNGTSGKGSSRRSANPRPVSSASDQRSPIRLHRRTSKNPANQQRLAIPDDQQSLPASRRSSAAPCRTTSEIIRDVQRQSSDDINNGSRRRSPQHFSAGEPGLFRTSSEIIRDAQRLSSDDQKWSSAPQRFSAGDPGLTVSSGSLFTARRSSSTQTDDLSEGPLGSVHEQHSLRYSVPAPDWKKVSASQVNPDEPRVWTRSHWHRNKYTRRCLWGALGTALIGCGVVLFLWWMGYLDRWWGQWYGVRNNKCSYCWLFRDRR